MFNILNDLHEKEKKNKNISLKSTLPYQSEYKDPPQLNKKIPMKNFIGFQTNSPPGIFSDISCLMTFTFHIRAQG